MKKLFTLIFFVLYRQELIERLGLPFKLIKSKASKIKNTKDMPLECKIN